MDQQEVTPVPVPLVPDPVPASPPELPAGPVAPAVPPLPAPSGFWAWLMHALGWR